MVKKAKIILSSVFVLFLMVILLKAQQPRLVAWWSFDQVREGKTLEVVGKVEDSIHGHYRVVKGVKGQALVFDGYTTCVMRSPEKAPRLNSDFTLSAWVALGAYPWNWAPIVAQENTVSLNSNLDDRSWPEDIMVNSPRNGFYFGISPQGYLGLHLGGRGWIVCQSKVKIPLRQWTHVAAVVRNKNKIELYINGQKVEEMKLDSFFRIAEKEPIRLGMNRQKIEPSHPVRPFATLACWYSLDGLLDEVKIYQEALPGETLEKMFQEEKPSAEPELLPRIMPSGPEGPAKFGASYIHLSYYPEWDNLWPVASDPDVVVKFDNSPVRVVFWRGTRYSPVWVMDKMHWMADQSIENFNMQDGCIEHMLDPHCRFSHVRIIENTAARVVVHWRYCPTSANGHHSQVDPITGWEDWVDEYYYIYPDQVGIRKVILHTEGRPLGPEEVIVLCHPGQRPEEVVNLKALTLANLKGQSHTYDWSQGPPRVREGDQYLHFGNKPEEKPVILMVNMKSTYKPFQVFETGNRVTIFGIEHRQSKSPHFPWWNHWPVAQIPSDGRYCQAPDRASHFSLAWGGPPSHKGEGDYYWWAWMYGATSQSVETIVPLARSWLVSPTLKLLSNGYVSQGYDRTQRCYVITRKSEKAVPAELEIKLEANAEVPLYHPALVVKEWGDFDVSVKVDGQDVTSTPICRVGFVRRVNQTDLVVWLKIEKNNPVNISFTPKR